MRVLLLANGLKPSSKLLEQELAQHDYFIAIDGACAWALEQGFKPDLCLGDLDSLPANFDSAVPIMHVPDQNSNDLEKALLHCLELGASMASILGAFGLRADHFLTNIYVLNKFNIKLNIKFIDDTQIAFMCPKSEIFYLNNLKNSYISLFPMADQVGPITSLGLAYELKQEFLYLSSRIGTLNKIINNQASVYCESDNLLILTQASS